MQLIPIGLEVKYTPYIEIYCIGNRMDTAKAKLIVTQAF